MARNQQIRARDSDRVEACALLDAARADGQLSEAEHTTRTRAAMRAKYATGLDALIEDLQIPGELADAAILHRDRPARPWWVPVAVLASAAMLGATVGFGMSDDPASADGATVAAGESGAVNLVGGSGLALFVDSYRREFGDAIIDMATIYPERALVQRVERGETKLYEFDGEDFTGRDLTLPTHSKGRRIDLATLDLPAVAAVLAGAPATVGLADGEIGHLGIGFELIAPADAGPVIDIYVGAGADHTGTVQVSLDGTPREVHPVG